MTIKEQFIEVLERYGIDTSMLPKAFYDDMLVLIEKLRRVEGRRILRVIRAYMYNNMDEFLKTHFSDEYSNDLKDRIELGE